jgi:hypothetical protein
MRLFLAFLQEGTEETPTFGRDSSLLHYSITPDSSSALNLP